MFEFLDKLDRIEKRLARALPVPQIDEGTDEPPEVTAARTSFDAFCGLIRIVPKSGPRVPLHRNAIQQLFEVTRTGRDIVLKPRQIGFTTLELARDLWTFLCRDGARVVVVCQSTSDNAPARLISGVLRVMIEGLREAGWPLEFASESWNSLVLPNGNSLRIIAAGASEASASKKGRAGTITRLHLTETAFYEHAEETLNALLECVPGPETGSEIVNESTPNGASGLFYQQCKSAESGKSAHRFHFYAWYHHEEYRVALAPSEMIEPRDEDEERLVALGVTLEQLKWRRLKIEDKGPAKFAQEYPNDSESCFIVSGSSIFDAERTTALIELASKSRPLEERDHGRIRIYARPERGRQYVLALDPSEGLGGDPAGGILLDRATGAHVATIDGQFTPAQFAVVAIDLAHEFNDALVAPERNNHGHAVILALTKIAEDFDDTRFDVAQIYEHDDGKLGWPTNPVTRPQMVSDLEDAFRRELFETADPVVLTEFRTFVLKDGKPQAAPGAHDDLVIAYAIGWAVRQRSRTSLFDEQAADGYSDDDNPPRRLAERDHWRRRTIRQVVTVPVHSAADLERLRHTRVPLRGGSHLGENRGRSSRGCVPAWLGDLNV